MIQTQEITLKIKFDDTQTDPPVMWAWRQLLDLASQEDVEMLSHSDITPFDNKQGQKDST